MCSNIKQLRVLLKQNLQNNATNQTEHVKEKQQVYDLIKRTVEVGESNSALIIGPKSTGKSTLIKEVIHDVRSLKDFNSNSVLVLLNGLIHTDDRLALISITSQMNLDNAVDGKVFGSFAENLAFLLACLRTGSRTQSKSVIFIIEEFDLFCFHHNQTLLYNLFDISQSAQAPVCVVGVTSRLDVIELLEKRVKSRFSHRQYFILPNCDTDTKTLLNQRIARLTNLLTINNKKKSDFTKEWNDHIANLAENKQFRNIIQRFIDIDLNEHALKNFLQLIISSLSDTKTKITVNDFEKQLKDYEVDESVEQLLDLNVLELCLVISMKHHVEIYDMQSFNFEMIFTRYVKFANANPSVQNVQRPVLMKSFEHLRKIGFIQPVATTTRVQKEYEMFKLLLRSKQINEAINKYQGLPTEIAQWAMSSLA